MGSKVLATSPLNPFLCHSEQPCVCFPVSSNCFPSGSHVPIPFSEAVSHLLVSFVCSLGSFGMSRTLAPSASSNAGPAPEAPTSSPAPPATSPTGASSAQQQLMQQMIQLLAGSGNSQVHGQRGWCWNHHSILVVSGVAVEWREQSRLWRQPDLA